MKRLIINADDFGTDAPRNAGIVEAVNAGVVTSLSVMTNGPAFANTVQHISLLSRQHISIGIHLNLSEGCPLTRNLRLLTGRNGLLPGKAQAYALLSHRPGSALKEEIYRETATQIEALLETGVSITHLDSHQHVHIFPAVIEIAVRAAETFGIRWLRIPKEPWVNLQEESPPHAEVRYYSDLAGKTHEYIQNSPVRITDHFRGLSLKGRMTTELLLKTLMDLPEGLTELMVHPGHAPSEMNGKMFSPFSNRDREIELASLTSPEFRNALDTYGIILTPFPAGNS